MTDQASARRAKGAANGEFTLSDGSLRQQQVGDIGTGHHEEESHRAEENDQRQANFSGEGILKRDDRRVLVQARGDAEEPRQQLGRRRAARGGHRLQNRFEV